MRTKQTSSAATRRSCWLSISVALLAAAAYGGLTKETVGKHTVFVYTPARPAADAPAPLLMLFHGSGRDGMSQINEWRKLADKEGIVLAAPNSTDTQYWAIPEDGPELLREIGDFVGKQARIDPRRIYAFGHSAGAGFMLQMAPLESTFFAAVAVHAGQFEAVGQSGLLRFAERKIPLFIVVGTKDPLFPVEQVRRTRDGFADAGFPVEEHEIPNHDHNYYRRSKEINDLVWSFLSAKKNDADGHFRAYNIEKAGSGVRILPVE